MNKDFSYNLGHLTISIRLYANDYTAGRIAVFHCAKLCGARDLTVDTGTFTMGNDPEYGSFTLNLQYVPASGPCQPGGLYLLSGTVTDPENGQSVEYTAMNLAAWDQQGKPITPWITPFDVPTLLMQSKAQNGHLPNDPFNTLARWTYQVDYRSSLIPPSGCSLRTTVDLELTLADEQIAPRLYQYVVTETDIGGHLAADVSAITEGAPKASLTLDESSWPAVARSLSFAELDVLRDAKAFTTVAFAQSGRKTSFAHPLRPLADNDTALDITAGYPVAPLASHLARFFARVTSPLMNFCRPLFMEPLIHVRIAVALSTTLAGDVVTMPLQFVQDYLFKPGFDDQCDCAELSDCGLCCDLAASIEAAMASYDPPHPFASYILDITFGSPQPLLRLRQAVIPLAKISD